MTQTYLSVLLVPPKRGPFFRDKESFLSEYMHYAKIEDPSRVKETEARVNFHLQSHNFMYFTEYDMGYFIFEAESTGDASSRMQDFMKDLDNVFHIGITWKDPVELKGELSDYANGIGKSKE